MLCSDTAAAGITDTGPGIPAEVKVTRARSFAFGHSTSARLLSYVSYLAGTVWHGLRVQRPAAFVTLTTPPVLSVVGSLLSIVHGARHIIWEMDIYPDIASDIGYFKRNGLVDRTVGALLDWSRKRATAIIVLGEDMKARLVARGIPESKIRIAENWADGTEIVPQSLPDGPLIVHYSGNLGLAHEIDTIMDVIGRLRNRQDIRFVFAGGGPRRAMLKEQCSANGFNNVEFRPYCSRAELGRSLGEGHLGLVTQLPQTLGSIVPSKVYGIMAAGRPLLYVGPDGSTPAHYIQRFQCGWHFQPGDVKGLEELLVRLSADRSLVSLYGRHARSAFEQNFNRATGISRISQVLDEYPQAADRDTVFAETVGGDQL